MEYICSECGQSINLTELSSVSCNTCGCRVLYKKRTKEIIEYVAR